MPQPRIDDAVLRILAALFKVGVFDRTDYGHASAKVDSAAHAIFAQKLAEAGTVLLKNDGVLPLPLQHNTTAHGHAGEEGVDEGGAPEGYTIAVLGDANNSLPVSVWFKSVTTPVDGIRKRLARLAPGNKTVHVRVTNHSIGYHGCSWAAGNINQCTQTECTTAVTESDIAASVKLAKAADIAIVNVALTSTEGYDRNNLSLGEPAARRCTGTQ